MKLMPYRVVVRLLGHTTNEQQDAEGKSQLRYTEHG